MKNLDLVNGLSAILAKHHLISSNDMLSLRESFSHRDDISFEDFLLEEGIVAREDLLQALSEYYQVPYCDTVGEFFNHQFLRLLPEDVLLEHLMIPYYREDDSDILWVVAADPSDDHNLVVLGEYVSHDINFMVGLPQDIRDAIREFYDESDTQQPNDIANQLMERSAQSVHIPGQLDERIPLMVEETIDDYESK
jgi:hypothetical protein